MKYEDEKFIIYYNECDKRYIELLVKTINERSSFICDFFEIVYDEKIVIKLYNNLEEYKKNLQGSFLRQNLERKYENWMIANTEDGNINMQSLDLVKQQDDFKYYTEEIFCYNACHEFTHLCQQYLNSKNPGWFWELIATNIGNPENQHESNYRFTLKELNEKFDKIDGYGIVYKFGKYIFENYDRDTILSWIKDNEKFMEEIEGIIESYNNMKHK
jgi:hypothetical protein